MTRKADPLLACSVCKKEPPLCLCSELRPVATSTHVVILQHPQEPDKLLGSASLTRGTLENSTLKIGLSWPNLAKVLGRPPGSVDHSRWGVLYLGGRPEHKGPRHTIPHLQIKPKGAAALEPYVSGESPELEGFIVLDGTWSQAKTLWWRNAWLLKLNRLVLNPRHKSMYGELRREPRREALSTIEAVAETLEALGDNPEACEKLRASFGELLRRYRDVLKREKTSPPQAE